MESRPAFDILLELTEQQRETNRLLRILINIKEQENGVKYTVNK